MVGNWAGQRRGIRLSAEMPDSTQDFLSISFSTRIQMGPTSRRKIVMFGIRHFGMTSDGCCSSGRNKLAEEEVIAAR